MKTKLKGLLIIGHNAKYNLDSIFQDLESTSGYLVLDYSKKFVESEQVKEKLSQYEIDQNTRIDIVGHGNLKDETNEDSDHTIGLFNDIFETKNLLKMISNLSENSPIQAHLWSCYGGAAAKAVEELPGGSVVFGHAPKNSSIFSFIAIPGLIRSLKKTLLNNGISMDEVARDLVENLTDYATEDLNIGVRGIGGEVIIERIAETPSCIFENTAQSSLIMRSIQIQMVIERMKEDGVLPSLIKLPIVKEYGDEEITNYKFERMLFHLFLRKDKLGVDFQKLLKDGRVISKEEARILDLTDQERSLLDEDNIISLLKLKNTLGNNIFGQCFDLKKYIRPYAFDFLFLSAKDLGYFDNKTNAEIILKDACKVNDEYISKAVFKYIENITPETYSIIKKEAILRNNDKILYELISRCEFTKEELRAEALKKALWKKYNEVFEEQNYELLAKFSPLLDDNVRFNYSKKALEIGNYELVKVVDPMFFSQNIGECNIDVVKALINIGANVNDCNASRNSPLFVAIHSNYGSSEEKQRNMIRFLISKGANIDEEVNGLSHLANLISENKNSLAVLLIESGANIQLGCEIEKDLLAIAFNANNIEMIKYFILNTSIDETRLENIFLLAKNSGFFNNKDNKDEICSLITNSNNPTLAKLCLNHLDFSVEDLENSKRRLFLFDRENILSEFIGHCEFTEEERNSRAYKNALSIKYQKALEEENYRVIEKISSIVPEEMKYKYISMSIEARNYEAVKILDPKFLEKNIVNGNIEMVQSLIDIGANLNEINQDGNSPLTMAIAADNLSIIKLLIGKGANLDEHVNGRSHISNLILEGRNNLAKELVEMGANINSRDEIGRSSLAIACASNNHEMVKFLISKGANPREKIWNSELINQAISRNNIDLLNTFIEGGIDPNSRDEHGRSCLEVAVYSNNPETVKFLISKGANIEEKVNESICLIDYASSKGLDTIVEVMRLCSEKKSLQQKEVVIQTSKSLRNIFESKAARQPSSIYLTRGNIRVPSEYSLGADC